MNIKLVKYNMLQMKNIFRLFLFLTFIILGTGLFSQTPPTYYCDIRNESFADSKIFEFDLYLTRTGTTALELAGINTGIILNTGFVNGGVITASLVSGASELNSAQIPANISYDAAYRCVMIAPKQPPRNYNTGVTSGTVISNTTGTKVCRIRLTNSVDFGTDPANYSWSMNVWPYHTVVGAFVQSGSNVLSTIITNASSQSLSNNLTTYLEGLYTSGIGNHHAQDEMGDHFHGPVADKVTVKLANASTHTVDYVSPVANLYTNGKCSFTVPASLSGSYYLVVNHRNGIETWSASPLVFSGSALNYNFTDAASKAYGNNMIQVDPGKWAFFSGDVNQDDIVDSGDLNLVDNASTAITMGYVTEDVNGDGLVDSGDMIAVDNNSTAIVYVKSPF
jgi:hypothetical protein